jgi:hypothetical protein
MPLDPEATSISAMLDTILERLIGGFEAAGQPLPDRRYWTMQQPAADCEQLVVSFMQAYIGPVGDEANEPQRCYDPRTAQIDIQVLRCIPGPVGPRAKAPTAEAIQEASRMQAIDAWILLDVAGSLDTWDGNLGGPGMGVIATIDAGEAQGGFQGPTLHLTVAIPGVNA